MTHPAPQEERELPERTYARKYNVKKKFAGCMHLRQVAENETGAKNMRLDIVNDSRGVRIPS
jgi:hypothetical protein